MGIFIATESMILESTANLCTKKQSKSGTWLISESFIPLVQMEEHNVIPHVLNIIKYTCVFVNRYFRFGLGSYLINSIIN